MVFPWSSLVAWLLRIQRCYYYGVGLILAREFPYAAGTAKKNPPASYTNLKTCGGTEPIPPAPSWALTGGQPQPDVTAVLWTQSPGGPRALPALPVRSQALHC